MRNSYLLMVDAGYLITFNASASDALRCVPPPLPGSVGNVAALITCINNALSLRIGCWGFALF